MDAEAVDSTIKEIIPRGQLFPECSLSGEGKADGAQPAHASGLQLSKDRFILFYSTRGFRGRDDEWSSVYQIRADSWTGRILKEGYISQTSNEWDALGDGRKFVFQNGHATGFGVPKGAIVDGRRVSNENHFVAMWRIVARVRNPETGHVYWESADEDSYRRTTDCLWMQFRLNDAEDDIEILQTARKLRQSGYEESGQICADPSLKVICKGFVPAVPMNPDHTEWVDMNSTNGDGDCEIQFTKKTGRVVPFKYRWNISKKLYEWVDTGTPLGPDLFEGAIAPWNGGYVIASRMVGHNELNVVTWCRTDDPFQNSAKIIKRHDQPNWCPFTLFTGPDGRLYRLGGCSERSYFKYGRDPLFMVRIDPERDFEAIEHRKVFSAIRTPDLEFSKVPTVDFGKMLPHLGGTEQTVVHRVHSTAVWANPEEPYQLQKIDILNSGIYYETIRYKEPQPPMWQFTNANN